MYSTKFYTGRLRSEVQPLTLLYTIFDKKGTHNFRILSIDEWVSFSHTEFRIFTPVIKMTTVNALSSV